VGPPDGKIGVGIAIEIDFEGDETNFPQGAALKAGKPRE